MDFERLKNHFGTLKKSNTILVFSNAILVMLLLISLFINFEKDTVVINNLNESCEDSLIGRSMMNDATHKRLGFYLSGMLGNISPANLQFVSKSVMPFIDTAIYQDVKKAMALQLGELERDDVVMSFTPEKSLLEGGTTYITGRGTMTGPTGKVEKFTRTYEFDFVVENYTPLVRYINVYNDVAHDDTWKSKHKAKVGGNS